MDGLIEVKEIITETGYFYDYECMDIADLRDEYIVFVDYWMYTIPYLDSEERKFFPTIEDVLELGTEIERIGKDRLNEDFREILTYIRRRKNDYVAIKNLDKEKEYRYE